MSLLNLKCVKLTGMVFIGVLFFLIFLTSDHYKDNFPQLHLQQDVDYQTNPYLQERKSLVDNGKNERTEI